MESNRFAVGVPRLSVQVIYEPLDANPDCLYRARRFVTCRMGRLPHQPNGRRCRASHGGQQ